MRLPLSGNTIYSIFFKSRSLSYIPWILLLLVLKGCGEEVKKMRVPAVELYQEAFVAFEDEYYQEAEKKFQDCLLYTSPSPRDGCRSRMPSSA